MLANHSLAKYSLANDMYLYIKMNGSCMNLSGISNRLLLRERTYYFIPYGNPIWVQLFVFVGIMSQVFL